MYSVLKKFDWTIGLLICGLMLFLFGVQALVVWHFRSWLPPDVLSAAYLIQYDSAWAFALCGLALVAFRSRAPIIAAICSGSAMLIGLTRLLDFFVPGLDISVTPILAHYWLPAEVYDDLSPFVAVAFVFSGYMIGALKYPPYGVVRSLVLGCLSLVLAILALFFIIGSNNPALFIDRGLYFSALDGINAVGFLLLGVTVLCFVFFGANAESVKARRWAPVALWLAIVMGSLGLWQGLKLEDMGKIRTSTRAVMDAVGQDIVREMDFRIRALERFAIRRNSADFVVATWQQDARQLLRDMPEFRAIGWADADLTVRWIMPGGPIGGNLLDDPTRTTAVKAAQSSRNPALTRSVDLRIGGRGFQVYVPVYQSDVFQGVVIGTFADKGWLESLISDRFPRYAIEVLDGKQQLLQARLKEQGTAERWVSEKILALYNNEWRIRVTPTQMAMNETASILPEAVLISGVVLATLLAAAVFLYQLAGQRATNLSKANSLLALDIEKRKQAEQALRESERENRIIINGVTDHAIFMLREDGKISSWNKAAERLTKYRAVEIIGRSLDVLYPSDSTPAAEKLAVARTTGRFEEECWHQRKDGVRFCGEDVISPIRKTGGGIEGFAVITRDQTERIELRHETEMARDYYLRLFSSFPNMVWRTDEAGQCDYCNPAWLEFTGRSMEREAGKGWMEGLHPDDKAAWTDAFRQSLERRQPFEIQYRLRRADGRYGWVICSCRPYYNMQGDLAGYLASCYDNTVRRQMESEIESSRERILAFSRHLQTAREDEKAHLARELHDELGATLTALRLEVSTLLKRVPAGQTEGRNSRSAIQLADSAIQATRKIITDLRPSILDNLGLLAALRWHAADFSKRTGIKVDVQADDSEVTVDKNNALAFFRIAQESLTNVLKHSQASTVAIRFSRQGDNDVLNIIDDGVGMVDDGHAKPMSNGILGMRSRALALHGDFKIVSTTGGGTIVTATLPVQSQTPA